MSGLQHRSARGLRRGTALAFALAAGLSTSGCIIETPPSRYWIENNTDSSIVLRKLAEGTHLEATEVPPRQKVKVLNQVGNGLCSPDFEIVDQAGNRLRTISEICDGDTVIYP